ncbi:YigZ family protein [Polaromonas sp.]|uniref:YigZ family protein n=1 Tax=Polaromonas sp. TaxID=1869339 RepID=UPI003BAB9154
MKSRSGKAASSACCSRSEAGPRRNNCWLRSACSIRALVCDGDSALDDDGEPPGTAAKPMYKVLMHKDLMDVLAVVVRY